MHSVFKTPDEFIVRLLGVTKRAMRQPTALELLKHDRAVYIDHLHIASRPASAQAVLLMFRSSFPVVALFRLSHADAPIVRQCAAVLYKLARILSGVQIPRGTRIGGGLLLPHFGNIVIDRRARIGSNCTIHHNVTLGAEGRGDDRGVPVIGDRVYIGAGATLLGSIQIGEDAVIGAGSVVTKDVARGTVVAGNPARPIGHQEATLLQNRHAA